MPELLTHPNTACGLGSVLAISEGPLADGERFARLWAHGRVMASAGGATVDTGAVSAPLSLLTPSVMAQLYTGIDLKATPRGAFTALRVQVTDMAAAKSCVEARAGRTVMDIDLVPTGLWVQGPLREAA